MHRQLAYWNQSPNPIVELSDGELLCITREGPGPKGKARVYTNVPGCGRAQGRHIKALLGQLVWIDKLRAQNKSMQAILKQQADAARYLSDYTRDSNADIVEENGRLLAESERLRTENGRLRAKIEAEDDAREHRTRGQAINIRAMQWAYAQKDLSSTAKTVLMTFAIHSNEHDGYTWPGVDRIASIWGMDRETVRRQIEVLLDMGKIRRTKKRVGATGQVKVYRLPKITYESGGKCRPFEKSGSGGKARDKRGISGGESAPNKEQGTRNLSSSSRIFKKIQKIREGEREGEEPTLDEVLKEEREGKEPTLDEVLNFASEKGIDKTVADIWWNECESRLWIDRKTLRHVAMWRPHLTAYWRKWQNNLPPSSVPPTNKPLPKPDPSEVALPVHDFKPWLDSRWPELSQEAESWKTWADVPNEVRNGWWGETKPPFTDPASK
jgi:hypothetical protein